LNIEHDNYLNTIDCQISMWRRRQKKTFLLEPINMEPKSKKAISGGEKYAFQEAILKALKRWNKRYFKAPVALEIDLFPTANDPPAIHTIPKNYLDLLQIPIRSLNTRRKRLLLEDDRQIRYLAVKYHISGKSGLPSIRLKVAPYTNLLEDASLLDKALSGDIPDNSAGLSRRHSHSEEWAKRFKDEEEGASSDAIRELRDMEKDKTLWVSKFSEDVYEAVREMHLLDAQKELLGALSLSLRQFLSLISPSSNDPTEIQGIYAAMRDTMLNPPLAIDLKHSDLKEGESAAFKEAVKQALDDFKRRANLLMPLKVKVGVTILYQAPHVGGIDLDNLARRIIPFVHEQLQPPSDNIFTVDVTKIRDAKLKRWFTERRERLRRMPKYSVTHYQIVQLPRLKGDKKHGFVRLMFGPGDRTSSLWSQLEDAVRSWMDHVR